VSETIFWVILFLPLTAFVLAGISAVNQNLQRQIPEWDPNYPRSWKPIADLFCGPRLASTPLIIALAVAFLLAVINLIDSIGLRGLPLNIGTHELFTAGELIVNVGIRIDGLTSVMLVVVTGVSLLVQVYSTGYMDGDHGYRRYFAFMALFTTSMLGLVLADNLLMLFAFWELVGLTSYLLIGFWFHRPAAAAAAKKAFLVTRLGDLGMLAAMILIYSKTGTLDIAAINALADSGAEAGMFAINGLMIGQTAMTLFGLGLIAGAVGKSAQFPLHIWLPDAMEGPTPVSALVHSATMVAAGVYLLARFFPVIHASSTASDLIAWIGAGTALGAALLAQTVLLRIISAVPVPVDLALIVVVYAALMRGAPAAIWTGTAAGLLQDVLSGGIVGPSGLAKCLVGALVGLGSTRLMVRALWSRFAVIVAASLVHAVCFFGVYQLIDTGAPGASVQFVVGQAVLNGLVFVAGVGLAHAAPAAYHRLRVFWSPLAGRRWELE
jgi:rod shape-determining protein MreD